MNENLKQIEIEGYNGEFDYPEDVERIRQVLLDKGYIASLHESAYLWDQFSDSLAASWMILPESDEEVFDSIRSYILN